MYAYYSYTLVFYKLSLNVHAIHHGMICIKIALNEPYPNSRIYRIYYYFSEAVNSSKLGSSET